LAKFVPNVLTADVLRKLKIPTANFNASFEGMMRVGVDRMTAFQNPSGGWGWFDRDGGDSYMTACAVHGLSECDRLGFKVDRVVLKRGRDCLRTIAQEEQDLNRLAYEAYVLGEEFERLLERREDLSPYARALLALTLHRAGRPETIDLIHSLLVSAKEDHWEMSRGDRPWGDLSIETTAYAIQALVAADPGNAMIPKASSWLLAQRIGNRWHSTKDTAVAIATLLQVTSLERLAEAVGQEGGGVRSESLLKKIGVTLNGGERREIHVDVNNPTRSLFEAHFGRVQAGSNVLAFQKLDEQSDFKFDLEVMSRGFDAQAVAESRGMDVTVVPDRPLEAMRVGDEVTVTVTVSAASPAEYVLIQSPIPAGCEIVRGSGLGTFARFEDRYDRALFFLRSVEGEGVRLTYRMRCAFAGQFTVLPPSGSLMYNEDVYGIGAPERARIAP
jgi:uncharacterized protein YfaS (alpha-2-macroglobulin family)